MDHEECNYIDYKSIEEKSKELAKQYGLKQERVKALLERFEDTGLYNPDKSDLATPLEQAADFVEPEKALLFLESQDLLLLKTRKGILYYLEQVAPPVLALDELADLLSTFLAHHERNKEHLIKTGFPRTSFERSVWLEWYLNKLYFVKLPVMVPWDGKTWVILPQGKLPEFERDELGNRTFSFLWAKEPNSIVYGSPKVPRIPLIICSGPVITHLGLKSCDGMICTEEGQPLTICDYEDAAIIDGVAAQDAAKLEQLREHLFLARNEILKILIDNLKRADPNKLWEDSIGVLIDRFSSDEARFFLRMDKLFEDLLEGGGLYISSYFRNKIHHNSALSDIFSLIWHCEKEITIGSLQQTKRRLNKITSQFPLCSYYKTIDQTWHNEFNSILDDFLKLESKEQSDYEEYLRRINSALDTRLDKEVIIKKRVKPEYAEKYTRLVDSFANFQATSLEVSGRFATMDGLPQVEPTDNIPNMKQARDYKKYSYKCRDRIDILGEIPMKRSNTIILNGKNTKIPDSLFPLFLRFVEELRMNNGGWIHVQTLEEENLVNNRGDYRPYSRLKSKMEGYLLEKKWEHFLENDGSGSYRISTHPDFISYDKEKLLEHPNALVSEIAARLP